MESLTIVFHKINNFLRWTNALTPQDVWNEFKNGTGGNGEDDICEQIQKKRICNDCIGTLHYI